MDLLDRSAWDIHAYAIVSRDDCIAGASGVMPPALHNDADWAYFQRELALSQAVILGRAAHEATPNVAKRLRIIMSRSAAGLERRGDGWWWNPAGVSFRAMATQVVPGGGRIAVPGGRGPFDWFLNYGFDGFHLAIKHDVELPGGVPVFSACTGDVRAQALLAARGLVAGEQIVLDPAGPVTMTIWRR